MNDNFLLYKSVKEFSFEIMRYTNNVPKSMFYIRNNLQVTFDNALRLIRYYIVNIKESERIKFKYLKDLIVEISMIDYYLEFLLEFGALGKNKFNVYAKNLEEIRKMTFGVIKSEKK